MRAFDLSPLLRSTVGFDRFDRLLDAASRFDDGTGYPPYNIEVHGEDKYRVTLAVAGFDEEDLDITIKDRTLLVSGRAKTDSQTENVNYLHRGIARRAFERRFELADTIKVVNANLENGMLTIDLVREIPEAMKPRKINIERIGSLSEQAKAA